MARRPTQAQRASIEEFLRTFEPRFRDAFSRSIYSSRARVDFGEMIAAMERGDLPSLVEMLTVRAEDMWELAEVSRAAYLWMGERQVNIVAPDGSGLSWRFQGRNPRAVRWIEDHSSRLIQGIEDDSRLGVQRAIVDVLENRDRRTLRSAALDIVGRVSRGTGRREGGILGLTSEQTDWAISAREELARLDPNYLSRKLRDRRFDRTIRRAIRTGQPLTADQIERMTMRYRDRLLEYRGRMIATTETFASQAESRREAMRQVLERPDVESVTKRWKKGYPERHRPNHLSLSDTVVDFDEEFDLGDGVTCGVPHEEGLPAREVIWCRCWVVYRTKLRRG